MTVQRSDICIPVAGAELAAWLYLPAQPGPHPVVVMSHGFSCVKEQYLDRFALYFAEAGLAVVLFDHRNFGASSGEPRQEADPVQQARDYRDVITHLALLPDLDDARVGIWGTSYSGGHVLQVAAYDRRVKCVVAQVPTISGYEQTRSRVPPARMAAVQQGFADERLRRARGEPASLRPVIANQPGQTCVFDSDDANAYFRAASELAPAWRNEVTLATSEMACEYEPGAHIERISPTPLMMIVARNDVITPTDLALSAYNRALEPKQLVLLPGGHFDAYTANFEDAAMAARNWFVQHLIATRIR